MNLQVGNTITVGGRHAANHYYESLVGERVIILEIVRKPKGLFLRVHSLTHHDGWFIRAEDAIPSNPATNSNVVHLLRTQ